ncbi:predicted protein [Verticillium alfalfae VaMs.102]|uniref:Predicted protein n=1 Tax=Verticillium alfalfae (strain VaMs.102 / ATCC MYA-4576 / FGSC 10136) TaxID=526221 RepID=C9SGI9_VERA1|nr:predicted protein [Verticillium alfalfae VaMs.102]EEY18139.1 predicted protein [Verticillium alfalfae VaMs.102]
MADQMHSPNQLKCWSLIFLGACGPAHPVRVCRAPRRPLGRIHTHTHTHQDDQISILADAVWTQCSGSSNGNIGLIWSRSPSRAGEIELLQRKHVWVDQGRTSKNNHGRLPMRQHAERARIMAYEWFHATRSSCSGRRGLEVVRCGRFGVLQLDCNAFARSAGNVAGPVPRGDENGEPTP